MLFHETLIRKGLELDPQLTQELFRTNEGHLFTRFWTCINVGSDDPTVTRILSSPLSNTFMEVKVGCTFQVRSKRGKGKNQQVRVCHSFEWSDRRVR